MKRLAVCLAVAMLATFAAASPAAAQYAVYYDRDGGGGTAIQRIEVQNGTDNVWVWIGHKRNLAGDEVYLDTVPSNPGPEYRLRMWANSDGGSIRKVEGFTAGPGQAMRCDGLKMHSDNYDPGAWSSVRIPQSCLRGPGAVRVATQSWNDRGAYDDAPNFGDYQGWFTPWISQAV